MRRTKMARCINTLLFSATRTVSVSKMETTDSGVLGAASLVSLEGAVTVWVRSKYEHRASRLMGCLATISDVKLGAF